MTSTSYNLFDDVKISSANPMPEEWGKYLLASLNCKQLTPSLAFNRNFILTLIHLYDRGQETNKQIRAIEPLPEDVDFHRKLDRHREFQIQWWELQNKHHRAIKAKGEATKEKSDSLENVVDVLRKTSYLIDDARDLAFSAIHSAWNNDGFELDDHPSAEILKVAGPLLAKTSDYIIEALGDDLKDEGPDHDYIGSVSMDGVSLCCPGFSSSSSSSSSSVHSYIESYKGYSGDEADIESQYRSEGNQEYHDSYDDWRLKFAEAESMELMIADGTFHGEIFEYLYKIRDDPHSLIDPRIVAAFRKIVDPDNEAKPIAGVWVEDPKEKALAADFLDKLETHNELFKKNSLTYRKGIMKTMRLLVKIFESDLKRGPIEYEVKNTELDGAPEETSKEEPKEPKEPKELEELEEPEQIDEKNKEVSSVEE